MEEEQLPRIEIGGKSFWEIKQAATQKVLVVLTFPNLNKHNRWVKYIAWIEMSIKWNSYPILTFLVFHYLQVMKLNCFLNSFFYKIRFFYWENCIQINLFNKYTTDKCVSQAQKSMNIYNNLLYILQGYYYYLIVLVHMRMCYL